MLIGISIIFIYSMPHRKAHMYAGTHAHTHTKDKKWSIKQYSCTLSSQCYSIGSKYTEKKHVLSLKKCSAMLIKVGFGEVQWNGHQTHTTYSHFPQDASNSSLYINACMALKKTHTHKNMSLRECPVTTEVFWQLVKFPPMGISIKSPLHTHIYLRTRNQLYTSSISAKFHYTYSMRCKSLSVCISTFKILLLCLCSNVNMHTHTSFCIYSECIDVCINASNGLWNY